MKEVQLVHLGGLLMCGTVRPQHGTSQLRALPFENSLDVDGTVCSSYATTALRCSVCFCFASLNDFQGSCCKVLLRKLIIDYFLAVSNFLEFESPGLVAIYYVFVASKWDTARTSWNIFSEIIYFSKYTTHKHRNICCHLAVQNLLPMLENFH